MKKMNKIVIAFLAVGFGTQGYAAVTHTIINKSNRSIQGLIYYRGKSDLLKSCRPDKGLIEQGKSLISKAKACLLEYVQIQDGDKTIRIRVANASANIAKDVGIVLGYVAIMAAIATSDNHPIYFYPLASGIPSSSTVPELVVYAGTSTVWEYDGVSLVPKSGVRGYGNHDFTKSH